jgi:hypothetical protein
MPLLTGQWSIIANGREGTLNIGNVSATGIVGFNMDIAQVVNVALPPNHFQHRVGFWDESSQSITLHLENYQNLPNVPFPFIDSFLFEGCQFQMPAQPAPGQDVTWNLAGLFTVFGGSLQPNSRRHRFGWRASYTQAL